MGNFLKNRLFKTRENLFGRIKNLLTGKSVTGDVMGEIEEILITSDVSIKTSERLLKDTLDVSKGGRDAFIAQVKQRMIDLFIQDTSLKDKDKKPLTIMVVGVNGSGKTTTIGKLSKRLIKEGKVGFLGACDTFRAAAIEQLEIWGEKTGARVINRRSRQILLLLLLMP